MPHRKRCSIHNHRLLIIKIRQDTIDGKEGDIYQTVRASWRLDPDVLLAFYDFPAERWKHIRTTNPIESTFATVRLRTTKTKGCRSRMTALTVVIADIIQGVKFKDGEKLTERAA